MIKTHLRPPYGAPASVRAIVLAMMTTFLLVPTYAEKAKTEPIHVAAEAGDIAELTRILDGNADAWKIENKVGNQPLHQAAFKGKNEALLLLLDRGADVAARGFSDWTALHYAARGGHPETCRILLKRGADRDAVSNLKRTAMQCANSPVALHVLQNFKVLTPGIKDFMATASAGDRKKARELLRKKPELLNATGPAGTTAAMEAAAHNRVEFLKWLIESGADINLLTKDSETSALHMASSDGHVEVVKLLLKHKAKINPSPTDEPVLTTTNSPLSLAAFGSQLSERGVAIMMVAVSKSGDENDLMDRILSEVDEDESPADYIKSIWKNSPEPLRSRKAEIVKLLIAAGAKPDIKGRGAPLCGAVIGNHPENVRRLLDAGADPNYGSMGMTPLIVAAFSRTPDDLFRLLLEKGADPLLRGGSSHSLPKGGTPFPLSKESAMSLAARMADVESFKMMFNSLNLKKLTNQQKAHVLTSSAKHPDCLKIALSAGFDVNLADERKQTALHLAAHRDKPASIRLLLEAGADVRVRDSAGFTPLHNAAERGRTENVKLLLKEDASLIEARTFGGGTPLTCACFSDSHVETVALLIKEGAKVDAKRNGATTTALMYVASLGHAKILECLINAGADVNATSDSFSVLGAAAACGSVYKDQKPQEGFSPNVIGSEDDYLRVAELLIKHKADVNLAGTKKGVGVTPLEGALHAGSEAMLKLLLGHEADPDRPNKNMHGRTSIWKAIDAGNQKMFDLIMEQDVNLDALDSEKSTPLHFAAGMDQPEMVKALLKKGARINVQEKNRATPLMLAIFRNALKSVHALLEAGADRTITDMAGNTAMQLAIGTKNARMIELLKTVRKK